MSLATKERVQALSAGQSVVLRQAVFADTDTPVSAFLKLRPLGAGMLLESVEGGERWGRYSIICGRPRRILRTNRDGHISVDQGPYTDLGQPFAVMRQMTDSVKLYEEPGIELPRFIGGWVGYVGYGAVHWIEPSVLDRKPEDTPFPDAIFAEIDHALLFDNVNHAMSIFVVAHPEPGKSPDDVLVAAAAKIQATVAALRGSIPGQAKQYLSADSSEFEPAQTRESFELAVRRAREAILAGDGIQVVVSQRFFAAYTGDSFDLYRALRRVNPSPYMFFMEFPEGAIVGSSPEVLVRREGRTATLRPIAGTRKRGKTPDHDAELERELLADPKEIAEHVMLVDLGRNDLGRVCKPGSVRVTEKMVVERYSHVMHIVSNVTGELNPGDDAWSLLQATFPAGTVSGAPKVKAMQLIEELEAQRRGPYSGAVGYVDYRGDMDTGIMIRTMFAWEDRLMLQAGAGIVADSDPALEYQETLNKAGASFAAVKLVQRGFEVES